MSELVSEAFLTLKKEINNFDDIFSGDVEEAMDLAVNSSLTYFTLNLSTDKKYFYIKIARRYEKDTWSRSIVDESKFKLSTNTMRAVSYSSPSKSFVKRVKDIISKQENQIEIEAMLREKMQEQALETQVLIDQINEKHEGCIEMYRSDEYEKSFPILCIGEKKWNIDLDKNIVYVDNFRIKNNNTFYCPNSTYPLHLAIPFFMEIELYNLLNGD